MIVQKSCQIHFPCRSALVLAGLSFVMRTVGIYSIGLASSCSRSACILLQISLSTQMVNESLKPSRAICVSWEWIHRATIKIPAFRNFLRTVMGLAPNRMDGICGPNSFSSRCEDAVPGPHGESGLVHFPPSIRHVESWAGYQKTMILMISLRLN